MRTLILSLMVLIMAACGRETVQAEKTSELDPNRCPTSLYGFASPTANFADGRFEITEYSCQAEGTYTCSSGSRALALKITSKTDCLQGALFSTGNHTCNYSYQQDERGYTRLTLSCPFGVKSYDTTRTD